MNPKANGRSKLRDDAFRQQRIVRTGAAVSISIIALWITKTALQGNRDKANTEKECLKIERKAISETINTNGIVSPSLSVNLTSEKTGRVSKLLVKEGAVVKRGQVVAVLDSKDIDNQIQNKIQEMSALSLKASKAESRARRVLSLSSQSAVPQIEVEEIEESLHATQAEVLRIKGELAALTRDRENNIIRSPLTGVVAQIFAFPGTFVSPMTSASDSEQSTKSTIMQIYSDLQVVINSPESRALEILGPTRIMVSPSVDPKISVPARVDRAMPYVILVGGKVSAIPIRLELSDARPFLPGMNVDVKIEKPPIKGLTVREYAITSKAGKPGIYSCQADKPYFLEIDIIGRGEGVAVIADSQLIKEGLTYSPTGLNSKQNKNFFDIIFSKKKKDDLNLNPLK